MFSVLYACITLAAFLSTYLALVIFRLPPREAARRWGGLLAAALAGFCGILLISVAEYTWFYARNMFIYFFLFGLIAACAKLARSGGETQAE